MMLTPETDQAMTRLKVAVAAFETHPDGFVSEIAKEMIAQVEQIQNMLSAFDDCRPGHMHPLMTTVPV